MSRGIRVTLSEAQILALLELAAWGLDALPAANRPPARNAAKQLERAYLKHRERVQ